MSNGLIKATYEVMDRIYKSAKEQMADMPAKNYVHLYFEVYEPDDMYMPFEDDYDTEEEFINACEDFKAIHFMDGQDVLDFVLNNTLDEDSGKHKCYYDYFGNTWVYSGSRWLNPILIKYVGGEIL